MIQPFLRKLGGAFVLTLLMLALTGCGRMGPLEPPPADTSSTSNSQPEMATSPPPASVDSAASSSPPGTVVPQQKSSATLVPITKSFFLDPLIN
ncbi:MAG: LPS translocon maturation chaperone LptM [Methylovirgula sp.]